MACTANVNVRLPEELNNILISVSSTLERSKADIIRKGLKNYLLDLQEDIEDAKNAEKILAQNNPSYPLEEVMRELELEDELDN